MVRLTNMRGVDLTLFDFDYDLTWMGFFMNARGKIYGRFGGRDAEDAEKSLSLAGLKYAMISALKAYEAAPNADAHLLKKPYRHVEEYPMAKKLKKGACIHCHQVHDFHREWEVQNRKWSRDHIWMYPPPENVGVTLSSDQGNKLLGVLPGSSAEKAGLQKGDVLSTVNGQPVASYGDLQYALNAIGSANKVAIEWQRKGREMSGSLDLKDGWRESDFSWRASMWNLEPKASVYGKDLTASAKKKLGLEPKQLAFRQGNYVPPPARKAGIRGGDIIFGANGKKLEMTMLKFNVWVRLNFKDGDRIVYNLFRGGKRMDIPMTLRSRMSSGR